MAREHTAAPSAIRALGARSRSSLANRTGGLAAQTTLGRWSRFCRRCVGSAVQSRPRPRAATHRQRWSMGRDLPAAGGGRGRRRPLELVVVPQLRPERRPGCCGSAEHDRKTLLLIVETDVVVDDRECSTSLEVGGGVAGVVEPGEQGASIGGLWVSPFPESVVAAVGAREQEGRSEEVDRPGLPVVSGEDGGV